MTIMQLCVFMWSNFIKDFKYILIDNIINSKMCTAVNPKTGFIKYFWRLIHTQRLYWALSPARMFFTLCLLSSRMAAVFHNDTGAIIGSESPKEPQSLVHRTQQHRPISRLPSPLLVPILISSYMAQDQLLPQLFATRICNISLQNWGFKELWSLKRNPK